VVAGGNGQGTNNTQLDSPAGIYFDSSSNSLVIVNSGANNVVRWALGASSWTLVAGSIDGINGNTSTLLDNPIGLTFDPWGNMYVADTNNHRVQFFLPNQLEGITIVGMTGIAGNSSTLLDTPYSVALDTELNLYVSDRANSRVQKFQRY
jgi:hypothetical protein